jgi:hypothetical protein
MSNDPLEECFGGDEACTETHSFWYGIYARLRGLKPGEIPEELSEDAKEEIRKEQAYHTFGYSYADALIRLWHYILRLFGKDR